MLLDNDPTSLWETVLEKGERRIYDLTIDMKEVREVKGLKIVQADVSTSVRNYLPNAITIMFPRTEKRGRILAASRNAVWGYASAKRNC